LAERLNGHHPALRQMRSAVDIGFTVFDIVHIFGDIRDVVTDAFTTSGNKNHRILQYAWWASKTAPFQKMV